MKYQVRLSALRAEIRKIGLDGFILPRTDEFQGEFLAPYAERVAWLCGFTGSAGAVVVLQDRAVVMSDGRYTLQLRAQVDLSLYEVADSTKVSPAQWLVEGARSLRVGFDPWLHTRSQIEKWKEDAPQVEFVPVEHNPIDLLWDDQPERPQGKVILFPDSVAGKTAAEKRADITAQMKEKGVDTLILTAADSICWFLNVRGGGVEYSPLVLSYLLLHVDGKVDWFVDAGKVDGAVRAHLGGDVRVCEPKSLSSVIGQLSGRMVWLDSKVTPLWFEYALERAAAKILDVKDPCAYPKSIKTSSEQDSIRAAHILDGVAVVRFLKWLEEKKPERGGLDEILVAEELEKFRCQNAGYRGASFATIAGFSENGAIIHYRATRDSHAKISGDGLLLLDSGGQYEWGTTDITRTITIGNPTQEMRENYTRVLKGHIAVSRARFPEGTSGAQIDTLARIPLWEEGMDYAHGTGHGVGCYLGVHEEAASISPRGQAALAAGMLISNEPGYYREGAYGIRIENLVLVHEDGHCHDTGKKMLGFETVTLVPYDRRLIVVGMLSDAEKVWIDTYHKRVMGTLLPLLSVDEREWLARQCVAL